MKVEVKNKEKKHDQIPELVKNDTDDLIILKIAELENGKFEGVVLYSLITDQYKVGKYSFSWNIDKFKPFEGELALSND